MAVITLSDTGSSALTAGTLALHVHLSTIGVGVGNVGQANPANYYGQGLLRFSDGTAYWRSEPIDAVDAWFGVPNGATSVSWSMLGGAIAAATEVTTSPFVFPASSGNALLTMPDILSTLSARAIGTEIGALGWTTLLSSAWGAANLGLLVPVRLDGNKTYDHAWVQWGTSPAGSFDIGVFDDSLALITHLGSTVSSGATSGTQITAFGSPWVATPGNYYLALSCSATAVTVKAVQNSTSPVTLHALGVLEIAAGFPLATSPTVRSIAVATTLPVFGVGTKTTM